MVAVVTIGTLASGASLEQVADLVAAGSRPASTVIAYDDEGNVESVTVGPIVTTYTYNPDGSVATDTRDGVTREYEYDDAGNLVSIEEVA
jgi:YD repeat-containing protein